MKKSMRGLCLSVACIFMAAVMAMMLGGCTEGSGAAGNGDTAETTAGTATTTANPETYPTVTGTYNSKIFTVRYSGITEIEWPNDPKSFSPFVNGHTGIYPQNGHGYRIIDKTGKIVGNRWYSAYSPFGDNNLAIVATADDGWIYINTSGETIGHAEAPPIISEESNVVFYSAYVNDVIQYGLSDKSGMHITEPIYRNQGYFFEGLCHVVSTDGTNMLINEVGSVKGNLPDGVDFVRISSDGTVICRFGENGNPETYYQLYDTTGEQMSGIRYDIIGDFYNGTAPIYLNGLLGFIDNRGNEVVAPIFPCDNFSDVLLYSLDMQEDLILVPKNGKVCVLEIIR